MTLQENPILERPQLTNVYNFAKAAHDKTGAIRRSTGAPYWTHPEMVADIVLAYGGTDKEVALALLHDTVEDTDIDVDEIAQKYGEDVAEYVSEITNDKQEIAKIGKEEYINQELINLDHSALFVKLADIYANMLENPTDSQRKRMLNNLKYLLTYRFEDLTDKERRLIKSIPGINSDMLNKPEVFYR